MTAVELIDELLLVLSGEVKEVSLKDRLTTLLNNMREEVEPRYSVGDLFTVADKTYILAAVSFRDGSSGGVSGHIVLINLKTGNPYTYAAKVDNIRAITAENFKEASAGSKELRKVNK